MNKGIMYSINNVEYDVDILGEVLEDMGWIKSYSHRQKLVRHDAMGFDPVDEIDITQFLDEMSETEKEEIIAKL